ncbi:MAG: hypothetical protein PVG03_02380 [Desulfarculaceae bacterium]|jgi:hypothetical protein
MLIDRFLPAYDFHEYHQCTTPASPDRLYQAIWDMDMGRSPLVGFLLRLRELPWRLWHRDFKSKGLGRSMSDLMEMGFVNLGQDPPREFVFGLVGKFWDLNFDIPKITAAEFEDFAEPGYAKVAANIRIDPLGPDSCRLSTETRILCLGAGAKSSFRRYWFLIRPFSGLIRREWLRLIREEAEKERLKK